MAKISENTSTSSRERFVSSGKLKINIVEWGDVHARPIIMLHGLRAYARTWDRVASVLAKNYYVIALDQRGRGLSDWAPSSDYFTEYYVEDLKNVVDSLHLEKFILLGHSMGGATSLVFSQMYPNYLEGMVIEDIGPGSSASSSGADRIKKELKQTPRLFRSRTEAKLFWQQERPGSPDEAIEQRLNYMMIEGQDSKMRWRYDLEGIATARLNPDDSKIPDLWAPILKLNTPTLVLRGGDSDFLSAEIMSEMVKSNPNITAFEISGASHHVHDDNFEEFMARLETFLEELNSHI